MKKNVLIIGAGGVAQVVAHKCAQNNDVLGNISIASRTRAKCDAIIASIGEKNAMRAATGGEQASRSSDRWNRAGTGPIASKMTNSSDMRAQE